MGLCSVQNNHQLVDRAVPPLSKPCIRDTCNAGGWCCPYFPKGKQKSSATCNVVVGEMIQHIAPELLVNRSVLWTLFC